MSYLGGAWALIVLALAYTLAAVIVVGVPDPPTATASSGSLLRDAWDGVRYAWNNRTIRALGFSITTLNIAGGIGSIAIPLIILNRLGLPTEAVGLDLRVPGRHRARRGPVRGPARYPRA